jgi:hypothetical protein
MSEFARLGYTALALMGLAALGATPAAALATKEFVAACLADTSLDQIEGVGTKIMPKDFCACVAARIAASELTQDQVDIITKMHKNDVDDTMSADYDEAHDANDSFETECSE